MNIYQREIESTLPRLLALFDRNPISTSYGYGDRLHWGWKYSDYPNATPQGAVNGLARLVAADQVPFGLTPRSMLERIDAMIAAAGQMTADDGSLVEAFPREASFCVTALIAYDILSAARSLEQLVDARRLDAWRSVVAPMIGFLLRNHETHAVISNHLATAVGALSLWATQGDDRAENRCKQLLQEILRHQSSEGWFSEYGSADPGYETLGLYYLADVHLRRPDLGLSKPLERALDFLAYAAHPDGSFGGLYGMRNTRFIVPAAFEALAEIYPIARALALFTRRSIVDRRCVTLACLDEPNIAPMFNAYAWALISHGSYDATATASCLPYQQPTPSRRLFTEAKLLFDNGPRHYTVVSIAKGGLVHHFRKGAGAFCDSGVAVRHRGVVYTTQAHCQDNPYRLDSDTLTIEAPFVAAKSERLTPMKLVLLRLLALTLFRSRTLVELTKRMLVKRLITGQRKLKAVNRRTIGLGPDLTLEDAIMGPAADERLVLSGAFTSIHMASAGYWQRQDDTL